jgi:hypothetical protein
MKHTHHGRILSYVVVIDNNSDIKTKNDVLHLNRMIQYICSRRGLHKRFTRETMDSLRYKWIAPNDEKTYRYYRFNSTFQIGSMCKYHLT